MDKNNLDTTEKTKKFIECPRCNQKLKRNAKFCPKCGFVFANQNTVSSESLHFGKNDKTESIQVVDSTSTEYSQKLTADILRSKLSYNIFYFLVGFFALLMIVFPIFANVNIGVYISKVSAENAYNFKVNDYLQIGTSSNFFTLFSGVIKYLKEPVKIFNPTFIMFIYDALVVLFVLVLAIIGLTLMIISIVALFKDKQFSLSKRLTGIILALSLIMITGLNCYGVGPIILSVFGAGCLIYLYIFGIVSKEKPFLSKQFIHKSISFVLLSLLLFFSSFGLVKLNIDIGSKIYLFQPIADGSIKAPNIITCRGLFLEYMQFVQSSSGDDVFKNITFIFAIFSFILHTIYLFYGVFSCVSILKSLSRQSIRFPYVRIIISTVAFYAFTAVLLIFNKLANDIAMDSYIASIGSQAFGQLSKAEVESIEIANKIFALTPSMIVSIILYLPTCIYTIIARNICLKKNFS